MGAIVVGAVTEYRVPDELSDDVGDVDCIDFLLAQVEDGLEGRGVQ